ncbi:hypothetical protein P8452_09135 [Trifolium repens]|nr:hypothetical protein P8452_09135 [Trifolium repens]
MAEYGYVYRSVSTYSTMRNGAREPAVIKPFVPFLPKSNGSNYSEGAVTKKTIVPVTSRPYDEPATEKYVSSGDESDDDDQYRRTSAVHNSPRKVDNQFPTKVQNHEASRNPQRFGPVTDRGRHSPQPTAEGRKPIGISPIRNDNYDGPNGYGGDNPAGVVRDPYPHKEGRKPIGGGSIKSSPDGYNNGYGGDKEGRKPIGISPIRNDSYDGPNGYGGDRRAPAIGDPNLYKEGRKPIGIGSIRSTHDDGYNNGYGGDKEGRKPIVSSIKNDNYDVPNGYGSDYNKKDGYKPTRNGNGYGIANRDNKPFGSSSNPKYDDGDNVVNYYSNRSNSNGPKISSDWTRAPRQGTQLSEPIHDIDKAMELLKMEAAKRDHYYDSPTPTPLDNWGATGNSSPRLTDRTGSGITRPHGNFNQPQSRPRDSATRVTFVDDGRDYGDDYYKRDDSGRYGYGYHDAVIDSREAEKKFKGTRV